MDEQVAWEQFADEISLKDLLGVLRKRFKIIGLITLAALLASAVATFYFIKPVYESYTTIMVGKPKHTLADPNNPITYQEIQTNRLLVSTYGEIAKSRSVLAEVAKNLNLQTSFDSLKGKVNVSLVKDTEIIQIRVSDYDPGFAAVLANEIARSFSKQVIKIMNVENVQVIDEAIPATHPVKPKPALNLAIAFLLGLMVGVFVAFVLEYFDTTIKTPEDVAKFLDLPVLGAIPDFEKGAE